jgi:hypothetical protein
MAVTHSNAARSAAANAVVDLLDVGGAGTLRFLTSGDAVVATLTFSATAFGAASDGVATAAEITPDTNAVGGTVAKWEARNNANAMVFAGSAASPTGGDINLSSLTVGESDTVSISSLTYTAAP